MGRKMKMPPPPPPVNQRAPSRTVWAGSDGILGSYIARETRKTLEAYRSQPNLATEHANHEEDTARGGWAWPARRP